jgi:hypothetical protein
VLSALPLLAISITMTMGLGGWALGLSSVFVGGGRIEVVAAYAARRGNTFTIFVDLRNEGTGTSVISSVYLNEYFPVVDQLPLSVAAGQSKTLQFSVPTGNGVESGIAVQVSVHTVEGMASSRLLILP